MNKKPKLNIQQQIDHMIDQGITFNENINIQKARQFLSDNNYYFKVKAYSKNYKKTAQNTYVNLDFAYLVELSVLDMLLRQLILKIGLNCEHILKTELNKDFCKQYQEDGYKIVKKFLEINESVKNNIAKKKHGSSYIKDLLEKYNENMALWNLLEVLTFGDFLKFYDFFYKEIGMKRSKNYALAYSARIIRNASAHNNCILNNLKSKRYTATKVLKKELADILKTKQEKLDKDLMRNQVVNDILCLIVLFFKICKSKHMRQYTIDDIKKFFKLCTRKNEYFKDNDFIRQKFIFLRKTVLLLSKTSNY
ncbi:Abi family protein [Helicobacter sp. 11S02629-2]|uniref:Abi family protein n=1 Tax=Helicobacter sp. 11S02629-2 TaxID=1476195 RepID=UPI000BA72713|nr:Abi family protein [Helicobacter sp. 11S02629-2]PAF45470.1 hypothetical protein BKH40_03120 [Helicobacter sp. 11S02629-2]